MSYCHQCQGGDSACKRHSVIGFLEFLNEKGIKKLGEVKEQEDEYGPYKMIQKDGEEITRDEVVNIIKEKFND